MGGSWSLLVAILGALWNRLGSFWEPSGNFVGASGSLLGAFWEPSGSVLEAFWGPSGNFSGCFLGAFCEVSRSLLGASWSISRKQILRQKYIGRIATKGKKRRVFIGSKQGRHPTKGKKDDFLEEKCTKATKKRQKTAFFSRKNRPKQQNMPKTGGFSLIRLGLGILFRLGPGVTKRKF